MNIVVTAIDENPLYWELLLAFLASIEKNSPDTRVSIYLMNLNDAKAYSLVNFKCALVSGNETHSGTTFQKNYMRHTWIADHLPNYERVAWIDPDCIIRKPIGGIFDEVTPKSIRYWHKHGKKEKHQVQGGVYVLGSSNESIKFCNNVYSDLDGTDDWMLPQTVMLRRIKKSKLNVVPLPESYNDSNFKDDSFIWHAKTSRRNNAKYQHEFRKYLKIGKEIIGE